MQCASNIHVLIQYSHSAVFSSSRVWDLPTNVTNVPSLPPDVCCFLSIFAMQEFSTGVLHFPRFAVPGKQINCQCLDDVKPVKSHYWMSPLRWWWLMHLFHHLPVCLCRAHQCLPAPAPLPVRGVPGLYFLGDLDPRVVLFMIQGLYFLRSWLKSQKKYNRGQNVWFAVSREFHSITLLSKFAVP